MRLNADSAESALRQKVEYTYDTVGRLTHRIAVVPGGVNQTTAFYYNAPVVGETGVSQVSANNGWISVVLFPHPQTGAPTSTDGLWFTYYPDGSVATRTDARGNTFTHTYDALGRRIATGVDDHLWYPPPTGQNPDTTPPGRVRRIAYGYNDHNLLETISAYTRVNNGDTLLAQTRYELHRVRRTRSTKLTRVHIQRKTKREKITPGNGPRTPFEGCWRRILSPSPRLTTYDSGDAESYGAFRGKAKEWTGLHVDDRTLCSGQGPRRRVFGGRITGDTRIVFRRPADLPD